MLTKAVLFTLSTPQFYLLTANLSLPVDLPMPFLDPPRASALFLALGLSVLMAVGIGATTEALRRGPVGKVSLITGSLPPSGRARTATPLLRERS